MNKDYDVEVLFLDEEDENISVEERLRNLTADLESIDLEDEFDIEDDLEDKLTINNEEFSIKDGVLLRIFKGDKRVVIPKNVVKIGTFNEIYDLEEKTSIFMNENMEELVFPNTVRILGNNILSGCNDLKKIILTSNIKKVGRNAFSIDKKINGRKGEYTTSLPLEFVLDYYDYESLEILIDKMIASGSFEFKWGMVPKFNFTLVGPELTKIEKLKLLKRFSIMRVNSVKYIDAMEKIYNNRALIECLNIINSKKVPVSKRDISVTLKHSELLKCKFMEINRTLEQLNLSEEVDKKYREYLIKLVKMALYKLGNNEYDQYEMIEKVFNIHIDLLDMSELELIGEYINDDIMKNCLEDKKRLFKKKNK